MCFVLLLCLGSFTFDLNACDVDGVLLRCGYLHCFRDPEIHIFEWRKETDEEEREY